MTAYSRPPLGSSNEEVAAVAGARRPQEFQYAIVHVVEDDGGKLSPLRRREQIAHCRRDGDQIVHGLFTRLYVLLISVAVAVHLRLGLERTRGRRPHGIGV